MALWLVKWKVGKDWRRSLGARMPKEIIYNYPENEVLVNESFLY